MPQVYTESLNIWTEKHEILFTHETSTPHEWKQEPSQHAHACYELYILLEGEVDLVIEGVHHTLTPGTAALLRSGEAHTMAKHFSERYAHIFVYFSLDSFPPFAVDSPLAMFSDRAAGEANLIRLPQTAWETLLAHVAQIETEQKSRIVKYAAFLAILDLLSAVWHETYIPQSTEYALTHPLLVRAVRYIDANFTSLSGVAELAQALGISHAHLTRLFRAQLDTTPSAVLRKKRIAFAKVLLIDGRDVTDTCYRVGFSSYSNFIRLFREQIGMTPLAFQRANGIVRR